MDLGRFTPVICAFRSGGDYEPELRKEVRLRHIFRNIRSSTISQIVGIPFLRRVIQQEMPDIVISFVTAFHPSTAYALSGMKPRPKLIFGMQNNYSAETALMRKARFSPLFKQVPKVLKGADSIVALSKGVAEDLRQHIGDKPETHVIYNAGYDSAVEKAATAECPEPRPNVPLVVACGRLSQQKDYPTLLRAWELVVKKTPAVLWILGTGPDRQSLEQLRDSLGLKDSVRFMGFQKNPFAYMAKADLFVLSSLWEGFANVIVEAMACGVAVVSTDCPYGPSEILEGGRYGELTKPGDAEDLGARIQKLLLDEQRRQLLASQGNARAKDFSAERITREYENYFASVANVATAT